MPAVLRGLKHLATYLGVFNSKTQGKIMTTVNQTPNGVYPLNLTIPSHQLFETINACLCKAHALAAIQAKK